MSDDALSHDRALVAALAKHDAAGAAALLDDEFNWVDGNGNLFDKAQVAAAAPLPPLGDEAGLTPTVHDHGEVVTVVLERDKIFVLRIWVKRAEGWRLISYHEVSQLAPLSPHGPSRREWDNPARTIPYLPRDKDERDCMTSWQQLELAVMHHNAEIWARHIADEFLVVSATRRHSKTDRKAVIEDQKKNHANAAPAPLVSARLFGFTDALVMLCEHQPFHGKAARVSRVFVKRDGQWLMAVSFQTTRQDAPVKTI